MFKLMVLFITSLSLFAQDKTFVNVSDDGLGIQGYDPVAYFTLKKAVKGNSTLSFKHDDVTYYFSSEAHLKLFKKSPNAYLPEYGGWCAYGCSGTKETTGFTAGKFPVDPKTFKIIDNKLYLYYNKGDYNALDKWNTFSEKTLLNNANNYWDASVTTGNN